MTTMNQRILLVSRPDGEPSADNFRLDECPVPELAERVEAGTLRWRESVAEGLASAPEAFFGLLKGRNFGKQLVRLG